MAGTTPEAGWWQASDGNWYPPEQHPDPTHRAQPADATGPGAGGGAGRTAADKGLPAGGRGALLLGGVIVVALLAVLVVVWAVPGGSAHLANADPRSSMYGYNPDGSIAEPGPAPGEPSAEPVWTAELDVGPGESPEPWANLVSVGGQLFARTHDGRLHRLDPDSGDIHGSETVDPQGPELWVHNGVVHARGAVGFDGEHRWSEPDDATPLVMVDTDVLMHRTDQDGFGERIARVDLNTGEDRWEQHLGDFDPAFQFNTFAAAEDTAFLRLDRGAGPELVALSGESGEERWHYALSGRGMADHRFTAGATPVLGNTVFAALSRDVGDTTAHEVVAVSIDSGEERWSTSPGPDDGQLTAVGDTLVWEEWAAGRLVGIDPADGEQQWEATPELPDGSISAVTGVETTLVGVVSGGDAPRLFAIDSDTGDERWSLTLDAVDWAWTNDVTVRDGRIHVAGVTEDGDVEVAAFE
ncbi:hypothetical protein ER308_14945 [Egibacter rhizosphaerae]|uniref:Pyrrolo-quinoline quinone repeat domain-containing protein n=1 Tax=Egibacter rhizosphaerae TaxID=1670831 RepID=A0A411YHY5_9ACTN|nr:PQQ-binding-like beta-propeller repeat protein [Egibacter rhizosphaerae]QBI20729.1 hypothetical protein ER308_14945 [Egibacter rhizosphaerae]